MVAKPAIFLWVLHICTEGVQNPPNYPLLDTWWWAPPSSNKKKESQKIPVTPPPPSFFFLFFRCTPEKTPNLRSQPLPTTTTTAIPQTSVPSTPIISLFPHFTPSPLLSLEKTPNLKQNLTHQAPPTKSTTKKRTRTLQSENNNYRPRCPGVLVRAWRPAAGGRRWLI
ncbi:hypothetical protein RHGRI_020536 [Rhododendron griersonianum]|uniref:Uncharacterized protein n=1 Tax=Rhododendron griersonianum TaxID=479676 RepID=A0AAV6JGK8_9ERIC|nr:hypothetical protein RHGRI_020536 [Rhododendron griersonianum]